MLAVQYEHITKLASAFVRGEWFYFGKQYFDLENDLGNRIINYSRAGITYNQFSFSVWLRNITGTKYIAYAYNFGAARLAILLRLSHT
jgi:iron complex outermembrane receptor protein